MAEVNVTNKGSLSGIPRVFFNFSPQTLSKKRLLYNCFPRNFVKFIRIDFLYRTPGSILESQAFYKSLLIRNVHQFIFIVFKESFLSKVFKVFYSRSIASAQCNGLDLADCQNHSPSQKVFEWVGFLRLIHLHRLIHIHFGSSQPLVNYSNSFRKEPAASFCKNKNCCFPDEGNVGRRTNKFT